jgi:hypothetical protein
MSEHASFNDLVRRAAGHHVDVAPSSELPTARKIGDAGIGRGAAAAPRRRRSRSDEINAAIRDAAGIVRERVTVDDLWR